MMAKGQGLNSLIPPKDGGGQSAKPAESGSDFSVEADKEISNVNRDEERGKSRELSKAQTEEGQDADGQAVFQIEVEKIKPNPHQPRKDYNEEGLKELANSIREVGIIQPLVVSKVEREVDTGTEVEYQLISGERRLRASKMIGLDRVPAVVRQEAESRDKLSMALVENIQRSDLNPIETARAYSKLQDKFGLTQREVATKVGKSRSAVANTLRLLKLPSKMQEAVAQGRISASQARLLLSMDNIEEQRQVFQKLLDDKMSTKELRKRTKKKPKKNEKENKSSKANREERFWQQQLEERLSAPVEVSKNGSEGKIIIKFFSGEEWRALLDRLLEE